MALVLLLSGCSFCETNPSNTGQSGLSFPVIGMPAADVFSATMYEDYNIFPEVSSAKLIDNGRTEEIMSNDLRVVRLLNALSYSLKDDLTWIRQGYVEEAEISDYLVKSNRYLEISFHPGDSASNNHIARTGKIIVCGHSYLVFLDQSLLGWVADGDIAEQHWPYTELVSRMIQKGELREDVLTFQWEKDCWIDLLEFAGFGGQGDGFTVPGP